MSEAIQSRFAGRRYILFCDRFPQLVDALESFDLRRIDVVQRTWDMYVAFDRDSQYRAEVDDVPTMGRWGRLLTRIAWIVCGYSPKIGRVAHWKAVAPYAKADLLAQLAAGLEADDDIIQQWLEGDEVVALVEAAADFDEVVMSFRCIGGDFDDDADARQYLVRVLGPDNEHIRPESDDA